MIDPNEVDNIFQDCLLEREPETMGAVIPVEGIVNSYYLSTSKLISHKKRIKELLMELPVQFRRSGGGGWSFLNACVDKNGDQWTGLHLRQEQLMCLGIGIGMVKIQLPRELWNALPGGVPYFVIND